MPEGTIQTIEFVDEVPPPLPLQAGPGRPRSSKWDALFITLGERPQQWAKIATVQPRAAHNMVSNIRQAALRRNLTIELKTRGDGVGQSTTVYARALAPS